MAKAVQIVKTKTVSPRGLSYLDAAKYIDIAQKTLRNKVSSGDFPVRPRRFGGKPLFLKEDLDDFLDALPVG